MKKSGNGATPSLVPLNHVRAIQAHVALLRADLIYDANEEGYCLCLYTNTDAMLVARREGDQPRNWRSVDRALSFIKQQLGVIADIRLIHHLTTELPKQ